jgi:hypothetical protein
VTWTVVERTPLAIRLVANDATLLIAPSAADDIELRGVIARFAPHLAFGPPVPRGDAIERVATSHDERIVAGQLRRGAAHIAYVLASRVPIDIDDVLIAHLVDSPFAHLAE